MTQVIDDKLPIHQLNTSTSRPFVIPTVQANAVQRMVAQIVVDRELNAQLIYNVGRNPQDDILQLVNDGVKSCTVLGAEASQAFPASVTFQQLSPTSPLQNEPFVLVCGQDWHMLFAMQDYDGGNQQCTFTHAEEDIRVVCERLNVPFVPLGTETHQYNATTAHLVWHMTEILSNIGSVVRSMNGLGIPLGFAWVLNKTEPSSWQFRLKAFSEFTKDGGAAIYRLESTTGILKLYMQTEDSEAAYEISTADNIVFRDVVRSGRLEQSTRGRPFETVLPITVQGGLWGVLALTHSDSLSSQVLNQIEIMANVLGIAMEKMLPEDQLQNNDLQAQTGTTQSDNALWQEDASEPLDAVHWPELDEFMLATSTLEVPILESPPESSSDDVLPPVSVPSDDSTSVFSKQSQEVGPTNEVNEQSAPLDAWQQASITSQDDNPEIALEWAELDDFMRADEAIYSTDEPATPDMSNFFETEAQFEPSAELEDDLPENILDSVEIPTMNDETAAAAEAPVAAEDDFFSFVSEQISATEETPPIDLSEFLSATADQPQFDDWQVAPESLDESVDDLWAVQDEPNEPIVATSEPEAELATDWDSFGSSWGSPEDVPAAEPEIPSLDQFTNVGNANSPDEMFQSFSLSDLSTPAGQPDSFASEQAPVAEPETPSPDRFANVGNANSPDEMFQSFSLSDSSTPAGQPDSFASEQTPDEVPTAPTFDLFANMGADDAQFDIKSQPEQPISPAVDNFAGIDIPTEFQAMLGAPSSNDHVSAQPKSFMGSLEIPDEFSSGLDFPSTSDLPPLDNVFADFDLNDDKQIELAWDDAQPDDPYPTPPAEAVDNQPVSLEQNHPMGEVAVEDEAMAFWQSMAQEDDTALATQPVSLEQNHPMGEVAVEDEAMAFWQSMAQEDDALPTTHFNSEESVQPQELPVPIEVPATPQQENSLDVILASLNTSAKSSTVGDLDVDAFNLDDVMQSLQTSAPSQSAWVDSFDGSVFQTEQTSTPDIDQQLEEVAEDMAAFELELSDAEIDTLKDSLQDVLNDANHEQGEYVDFDLQPLASPDAPDDTSNWSIEMPQPQVGFQVPTEWLTTYNTMQVEDTPLADDKPIRFDLNVDLDEVMRVLTEEDEDSLLDVTIDNVAEVIDAKLPEEHVDKINEQMLEPAFELAGMPNSGTLNATASYAATNSAQKLPPSFLLSDLRYFMKRTRERLARVLRTNTMSSANMRMANQIIQETDTALDILDDVTRVAKLDDLNDMPLNLSMMLSDVIATTTRKAQRSHLVLDTHHIEDDVWIVADKNAIQQALSGLFGDILKMMGSAAGGGQITLNERDQLATIRLTLQPLSLSQSQLQSMMRFFNQGIPSYSQIALASLVVAHYGGTLEGTAFPDKHQLDLTVRLPMVVEGA